MRKKAFIFFLVLVMAVIVIACNSRHEKIDFSSQVKPILNDQCISCHGGVKKSAGFSVLFEEEAFANTDSGHPAIIPGDAENSPFIQRLLEHDEELRMPYKKEPLSKEEIKILKKWVNQGAEWGSHWAYQKLQPVNLPHLQSKASFNGEKKNVFLQNEIDHFILEQLDQNNLQPSPVADSLVLLRRLAFDLTGLPPSKQLTRLFLEKKLTYEQIVDKLLADKTFGEKWAVWWLDMARYADTNGYEKDGPRNIWRYRDWVIQAFNGDMPFDKFTVHQLAGDLLPNPDQEDYIATAFHRNTMTNTEGGTKDEEFRIAAVMDRLHTTFEVWQGTTIACVQCHSHPYDPFKYEEYYELLAFFNNTRDEDKQDNKPYLKIYDSLENKKIEKINSWLQRNTNEQVKSSYNHFLKFMEPVYHTEAATDFKNGQISADNFMTLWDQGSCVLPSVNSQGNENIIFNISVPKDNTKLTVRKNDAEGEILLSTLLKNKGPRVRMFEIPKVDGDFDLYFEAENKKLQKEQTAISLFWVAFLPSVRDLGEEGKKIQEELLQLSNTGTASIPVMLENPEYMERSNYIWDKGNWMSTIDTISAETPDVLNDWDASWPKNRLGLANWIVDENNPLTARNLVNRVWYQFFGNGIVTTLEDLGTQSASPTHPQLLDYLAYQTMYEYDWSLKSLIKTIVTSGTYRQSSKSDFELKEKDPKNLFYARGPRIRLSAEEVRDQALSVSGLLSDKMYGPSVMPPQPDGVWQSVYNNAQWTESKGEDKFRRGVYTYLKRTSPYPSFISFDSGSREICTVRRIQTNTPLQALVTLNDPVFIEASYHLAKKMAQKQSLEEQIQFGYHEATLLDINAADLDILKELYAESLLEFKHHEEKRNQFIKFEDNASPEIAALTVVANALMNLDEFITTS